MISSLRHSGASLLDDLPSDPHGNTSKLEIIITTDVLSHTCSDGSLLMWLQRSQAVLLGTSYSMHVYKYCDCWIGYHMGGHINLYSAHTHREKSMSSSPEYLPGVCNLQSNIRP